MTLRPSRFGRPSLCGRLPLGACLALCMSCLLAGCNSDDQAAAPAQDDSSDAQTASNDGAEPQQSDEPGTAKSDTNPQAVGGTASDDGQPANRKEVTVAQVIAASEKLVEQKRPGHAVQLITRALQARPDSALLYSKRAALLANAKFLSRAVADMTRAIELDGTDNPRYLNSRGYLHLSLKNYGQALQDFNDAIALDLQYSQPYNNRGLVRIALGQHEQSLSDFDAALRIEPDYHDARNNRGFALMQLQNYEQAIEDFTYVLEAEPEYVNALNNRGLANVKAELYDAAIADFTAAIEIQPGAVKYYLHRSEAHEKKGDIEAAHRDISKVSWLQKLADFNRRLARDSQNPQLWVDRGRHFFEDGQLGKAQENYSRAIEVDPDFAEANLRWAELLLREGKPERAIEECTQAILKGSQHRGHSVRGDAYLQLREYDKAIADFQKAQRIDPSVAEAYRLRAQKLEAEGNVQQASADRAYADSLDPKVRTAGGEGKDSVR